MSSKISLDGETSSPVDSSLEDDSRSSVASQTSEPAIQDTHTLLRLLPKSEIDTPLQDLPSSPIEPLDDTERYIPADPENISLPRHNVYKIMKHALPHDVKITLEAKEDMERCAREFIQFLTSEAAESVSSMGRHILDGSDVLEAMRKTGFENYAAALRPYLHGYRAEYYKSMAEKRNVNPDSEANGNDVGAAAGQDEDSL